MLTIKVNSTALVIIIHSLHMVDPIEAVTLAVVIGATSQTMAPTDDFLALVPILINLDTHNVMERDTSIIFNGPHRDLEVVVGNIILTATDHRLPTEHAPPMTPNLLEVARMRIMADLLVETIMVVIKHSQHRKARPSHPCNRQRMSPMPQPLTKAGSSVLPSNLRLHLRLLRSLCLTLLSGCKFGSQPLVHPNPHSLAIG
jgi:hypothetical protein